MRPGAAGLQGWTRRGAVAALRGRARGGASSRSRRRDVLREGPETDDARGQALQARRAGDDAQERRRGRRARPGPGPGRARAGPGPGPASIRARNRRCTTRWRSWVATVGTRRRRRTRARSSGPGTPARSRGARSRAAAAASWTARSMPTPPTGGMAYAASPMSRRPGRCQRRRRSTCTVSSSTSSHEETEPTDEAVAGTSAPTSSRKRSESPLPQGPGAPRADDAGRLPVVAAVEEDEHPAPCEAEGAADGEVRPRGLAQAEPQHVHGGAEVPRHHPGVRPQARAATVRGDGPACADLVGPAVRRAVAHPRDRAASRTTRSPRPRDAARTRAAPRRSRRGRRAGPHCGTSAR